VNSYRSKGQTFVIGCIITDTNRLMIGSCGIWSLN